MSDGDTFQSLKETRHMFSEEDKVIKIFRTLFKSIFWERLAKRSNSRVKVQKGEDALEYALKIILYFASLVSMDRI